MVSARCAELLREKVVTKIVDAEPVAQGTRSLRRAEAGDEIS